MNNTTMNATKTFRRIGLALFITAAISCGIQALLVSLPEILSAGDNTFWRTKWYTWLATFVPLYIVAIPAGLWVMRKVLCNQHEPINCCCNIYKHNDV